MHLRPLDRSDLAGVLAVARRQDVAWWGEADLDADELDQLLDMTARASGSLAAGGCVAVDDAATGAEADGGIIGVVAHLGHGHTLFAADPDRPDARRPLVEWVLAHGGSRVDVPAHDHALLTDVAACGLRHAGSAFELERPGDLGDLHDATLPDGARIVAWRPELASEVHAAIYSTWTDVPGHTHRDEDEWRTLFVDHAAFDPEINPIALVDGRVVGAAMCRWYPGRVGWVSQLGVARDAQGRGIGRALLVQAFRRLVAARPDTVTLALGVEAANDGALGLYRSVGLTVAREWQHWELPTA